MKMRSVGYMLVLVALLFVGCGNADKGQEKAIAKAVETLMDRYPEATLQDVYKSCFQDHFGVAHLLADRERVKGYIAYELASADSLCGAYYEPCGWRGNFVRVNLLAVRDGYISADELTDAFMASAAYSSNEVTEAWLTEWNTILRIIKKRGFDTKMADFAADSLRLAKLLGEGKYVMHHSEAFGRAYHPHYRIIHRSLFEEQILPRLK